MSVTPLVMHHVYTVPVLYQRDKRWNASKIITIRTIAIDCLWWRHFSTVKAFIAFDVDKSLLVYLRWILQHQSSKEKQQVANIPCPCPTSWRIAHYYIRKLTDDEADAYTTVLVATMVGNFEFHRNTIPGSSFHYFWQKSMPSSRSFFGRKHSICGHRFRSWSFESV